MVKLREERPSDADAIEILLDISFGAGRQSKVSYRYRRNVACLQALSLVAIDDDEQLVGTIRYWPIGLDGEQALLLGPIAVHPALHGRGIGRALVFTSLTHASDMGYGIVFLVGEHAYYERFGFMPAPAHIVMPGENPSRLQYRLLGEATLPDHSLELVPSSPLASVSTIQT